jgi:hypothetical protein
MKCRLDCISMRHWLVLFCFFNPGYFLTGFSQGTSVHFIENKNQWSADMDFAARVAGGSMMVRPGTFNYLFLDQKKIERLHQRSHTSHRETSLKKENDKIGGRAIRVDFLGSNTEAKAKPFHKLSTYYNYFIGSDSSKWASKVAAYEGVEYASLYSGIDLKLYGNGESVEYDFIVSPGADPSQIQVKYAGMQGISIVNHDVRLTSDYVTITEKKPVAFQWIAGKRTDVACDYALVNGILSFCFPKGYDACHELVIDPLLIFSTYSGSTADNWGSSATPGERGTLYSGGTTNRLSGGTFPATPGAFQTSFGGDYFDVAILKYDSIGQHLLYATYLGGNDSESPHSLFMNASEELLVLGTTGSTNFPTTAGSIDRTFNGGVPTTFNDVMPYNNGSDIFVAKLSKDGAQLVASTLLGGSANDGMNPTNGPLTVNYGDQLRGDIISDHDGNIYLSSVTASTNFPVANSFNTTYKGGVTDALIVKLNSGLSHILWGAFLGGSAADASHTFQLSQTGNIFAAGGTTSTNFPVTAGSYQPMRAGGADGWIARMTNNGLSIVSSTFTGTSSFDQVYFLDLNSNDEVYVYGQTAGSFPVSAGVYRNTNGKQFLQKFNTNLSTLIFSTVFGSGRSVPDISPTAFLVNDCNNIYMSGWGGIANTSENYWAGSSTLNMPTTPDAYQKSSSGSDFYFMVLTDDATQFLYGTYLGGNRSGTHVDGGTSRFDKGGVVYHAVCAGCAATTQNGLAASDFPTTVNAWSRLNRSENCNNAAFKFDLSSLRARIQTNSVTLKSPGYNKVCLPDKIVFQNRSTGGQYYEWDFGDGNTSVKPDTSAIVHQYAVPGQYTIKLKAVDSGTCLGSDLTTAVVSVYKPLGFAGPDQTMCTDATTHLVAGGGGTYAWRDEPNTFTSSQAMPLINPKDTTRYFVTIVDVNGCVKKDTLDVKVVPGIDLQFEFAQVYDCLERPSVRVVNRTEDEDEEIFFDFGDGNTSTLGEDMHQYAADGNYTIRIVGIKNSCVYDKKVDLPFFTLFVPNVITPGASAGVNDQFKIRYGEQLIPDTDLTVGLIVYNRWGGKVYENRAYKNNWSGEGLAAGVYYYEVMLHGEMICKNWVQIIR